MTKKATVYDLAAKAQDAHHYLLALAHAYRPREWTSYCAFEDRARTLKGRLELYDKARNACSDVFDTAWDLKDAGGNRYATPEYGWDFLTCEPENEEEIRTLAEKGLRLLLAYADKWHIDSHTGEVLER